MGVDLEVLDDDIALVRIDDGGRNALSLDLITELGKVVGEAADARGVVLAGRDGVFSAGLDVKYVQAHGPAGAAELVMALGEVVLPLWTDPRPTACAATGHALAGGTILAMACDHVVAAEGEFAWGLIEVAVSLEVPRLGMELAAQRLQARHVNQYVLPGARVDVATAVAIGYADESVAATEAVDRAVAVVRDRIALPAAAYGGMKRRLRAEAAQRVRDNAEADLAAVVAHLEAG